MVPRVVKTTFLEHLQQVLDLMQDFLINVLHYVMVLLLIHDVHL